MNFFSLIDYFPQDGQTVKFDYISIFFLIVLLMSVVINIKKGFFSALISLCAGIGSIILAILLCKPVGEALYHTEMGSGLYDNIYSWVSSQADGLFANPVTAETKDAMFQQAFEVLKIPSILQGALVNILSPLVPETGEVVFAEVLSESFATYTLIVLSFIVLWLVFFIVFKIIGIFTKKLNKVPFVGFVNRLLGGVLGLFIGAVFCFVICYGLSFVFSMGLGFSDTVAAWMGLHDDGVWSISKTFYEMNLIQRLIEMDL